MENFRYSRSVIIVMGFLTIFFFSCDSQTKEKQENLKTVPEAELAQQDTIKITLRSNDKMQFDKDEIVVFKHQTIILELIHTGSMPKSAMGHNFVLLNNTISITDYSKKALKKKENDYVIEDPEITLAHTKMLGGGESDEITFKAPPEGTYDFICSFPGHYANMKGKFIVK